MFLQFIPGLYPKESVQIVVYKSYFDTLIDEEVSLFNINKYVPFCLTKLILVSEIDSSSSISISSSSSSSSSKFVLNITLLCLPLLQYNKDNNSKVYVPANTAGSHHAVQVFSTTHACNNVEACYNTGYHNNYAQGFV